jgi:hypothetical protein
MAHKGAIDAQKANADIAKLEIELEEVRQFARQIDVSMLKVLADAEKGNQNGKQSNSD